jgi:type IV secretory pathway protease TraF
MAVAWPPPGARRLAARRRYLPANVPLVKTVAATSGARLCAAGSRVTVDGRLVALRRSLDPSGRLMPWWSGCVRLQPGDVFLLSPGVGEAFDGRYFGVTRPSEIIGSAKLLWKS